MPAIDPGAASLVPIKEEHSSSPSGSDVRRRLASHAPRPIS
jgi:hypothetical protein